MDANIMRDSQLSSRVAVYGTLRTGESNHGLLTRCLSQGTFELKGYEMRVMSGVNLHSIPFIVKSDTPEAKVTVELFTPQVHQEWPQILRELDWLEGHPDWYTRELVSVADGYPRVWVYTFDQEQLDDAIAHGRALTVPTGDWLNPLPKEEAA